MSENAIAKHISFLELSDDLPHFTRSLGHHIVSVRVDLSTDRGESDDSLRFEIFLHTREHCADSIDESVTFRSCLQFYGTFEVIYLSEKWHEHLR